MAVFCTHCGAPLEEYRKKQNLFLLRSLWSCSSLLPGW